MAVILSNERQPSHRPLANAISTKLFSLSPHFGRPPLKLREIQALRQAGKKSAEQSRRPTTAPAGPPASVLNASSARRAEIRP
jgi:hypothetical protein